MTEADFDFLRAFLKSRSGLSLGPDKEYLLLSRLGILCRQRRIETVEAVIATLRTGTEPELETAVVEAMTTNETLFFRDRTPFDLFRDALLPERLAANAGSRTLRIWCAAVSSGQEAYSLAMILDELAPRLSGWRIDLVGTDISGDVLERARAGLYTQFEIQRGLPIRMLLRHFRQEGDKWRVSGQLRERVTLSRQNLLEPASHLGLFDIVFCRNVLIYFDQPTKRLALSRIARQIAPGGALLLGSAETTIGLDAEIVPDPVLRSVYRARQAAGSVPVRAEPSVWPRPQESLPHGATPLRA